MDWPLYVTVAQRRKKAEKKINSLRMKNPDIQPIIIEGHAIAKTWWGKSWNKNLEDYADYTNRIGRGRMYVRHNAVLDLHIKSGRIESLVQGSRSRPYQIIIKVKPLKKDIWDTIKKSCQGELDSLQELLEGNFPKSLSAIFTNQKTGLFPSPREISFDCSCPDWADMCKHVAATLYGIGARLDVNPELFFTLRDVRMKDVIASSVKEHTDTLLKKAKRKSTKVIDGANLSEIFGIDLELPPPSTKKKQKGLPKKSIKKAPIRKKIKKKTVKKKTPSRKKPAKKSR